MDRYLAEQSQREEAFFDEHYRGYEAYKVPPRDMHDKYPWLFSKDLSGKRVCIAASIVDWYPIAFARMGAYVTGFDISQSAVDFAHRLAEFNGFPHLRFERKNFYELDYPDDSFDIVYGASVLHHLKDQELVARHLYRVIRPGGMAVFDENSDRNPFYGIARRLLFPPSQHGGRMQQGQLGFRRHGSEDENPLSETDVQTLRDVFGNLERYYPNYCFFSSLSEYGPYWLRSRSFRKIFTGVDRFIGKRLPFLHWSSMLQTLVFYKP